MNDGLESISNAIPEQQVANPDDNVLELGATLIQIAGQYLKYDQLTISTAIVYLQRFYSYNTVQDNNIGAIAKAGLFLAGKVRTANNHGESVGPDLFLRVFNYTICHFPNILGQVQSERNKIRYPPDRPSIDDAKSLYEHEMELLGAMGFEISVVMPYHLSLHYIRLLQLDKVTKNEFSQVTWSYINDAIRTTTLMTHCQPNVVACLAMYYAAKRLGINTNVGGKNRWWSLFDVQDNQLDQAIDELEKGLKITQEQLLNAYNIYCL